MSDGPFVRADSKPPHRFLRALRKHAWWMVLLALVAWVLAAREFGMITLDRYDLEKSAIVELNLQDELSDGTEPSGGWHPALNTAIDSPTREGLHEELQTLPGAEPASYSGRVIVDLTTLEYSGTYYMPYTKSGRVRYVAEVHAEIQSSKKTVKITGTLGGTVDFTAKGFCAVYSLKKAMGKVIGKQIADEVGARFLRVKP
ncbi:MAG: hypothetical protein HY291_08535 [Planctomycetes bacterium]|nr:hypothetical protein [Planctomycetota bacterium]